MNKYKFLLAVTIFLLSTQVFSQAKGDIPVGELPADVKAVLEKYVDILHTSDSLDKAAERFKEIAGGSLVNEDGSLRSSVPQFGLKKDFNNVKHYANPPKITRVNVTTTNGDGYGKTAIKGKVYQIWIAKDDPAKGMPAPIRVLVPEGHATITTPKVTNVGSY
jgi:hypothetical protein